MVQKSLHVMWVSLFGTNMGIGREWDARNVVRQDARGGPRPIHPSERNERRPLTWKYHATFWRQRIRNIVNVRI